MINWYQLEISIDNQAKKQLDHYFEDLENILESQNLSDKKNEIFHDLENHIIDYLTNNQIKTVTFTNVLEIISALGPPDEYTDFSNMPSLIDEIERKKDPVVKKYKSGSTNYILCQNCNFKNEENSIYCINCGVNLQKPIQKNKELINPLKFVFHLNPEYLLSLLSFYLIFLGAIGLTFFYGALGTRSDFFLLLAVINEFIFVPFLFILRMARIEYSRYELSAFLSTYLLKIVAFFAFVELPNLIPLLNNPWFLLIVLSVVLLLFPVLLTKIVFFSFDLSKLPNIFKRRVNMGSRVGYALSSIFLVIILVLLTTSADLALFMSLLTSLLIVIGLFLIIDWLILPSLMQELYSNDKFRLYSYSSPMPTLRDNLLRSKYSLLDKVQFFILICFLGIMFIEMETTSLNLANLTLSYEIIIFFIIFYSLFVIIDFLATINYKKSFNFFQLTLGIFFLDYLIIFTYVYRNETDWLYLFPSDSSIPILGILIIISIIILPLICISVLVNSKMRKLNDMSFLSNQIFNIVVFCLYLFLLLPLIKGMDIAGNITFISSIIILLMIKPFYNFINYIFIYTPNKNLSV